MRLNYKKVGDTLTQYEYNALCYLLTTAELYEEIEITIGKTINGKYANYTFLDPNNILSETREGYAIVKNIDKTTLENRLIMLKIEHEKFNSTFYAQFSTANKKEVLQIINEGIYKDSQVSIDIDKEDLIDSLTDKNVYVDADKLVENNGNLLPTEIKTEVLGDLVATPTSSTVSYVYFDPLLFKMKKGDYIHNKVVISVNYDRPILNIRDGALSDDDEILCETFDELKTVIDTAPEESVTKIRLTGDTYTFKNQILIRNKTVYIRGGNLKQLDNEPYTVLDAQRLARHFIVYSTASLHISNCKLINGNVYGTKGRVVLHNYGGSIYVSSTYELIHNSYKLKGGILTADYCWFEHNTAKLGGAIYTNCGNTTLRNCIFKGNNAISENRDNTENTYEYHEENWGGAVMNETTYGKYNKDKSDRIHLDIAKFVSNTRILIYLSKNQNSLLLNRTTPTPSTVKLINITDNTIIPISSLEIISQTDYPESGEMMVINLATATNLKNKTIYFSFEGNSAIPGVNSTKIKVE